MYFKYILNIWWVGSSLEFYDPNPTRPTIKKKIVTQPNLSSPKNRHNPAGWVGSGLFWWVGCTPLQITTQKLSSTMGMGLVQIKKKEKKSLSNGFNGPDEASAMEIGGGSIWWSWRSMVMGYGYGGLLYLIW